MADIVRQSGISDKNLASIGTQSFEGLKKVNEYGAEYWSAREIQPLLGYTQWRRFEAAIKKAITSCKQSGNDPSYRFAGVGKPMRKTFISEIKEIINQSRRAAIRNVDFQRVLMYWHIGRSILSDFSNCERTAFAIELEPVPAFVTHWESG